MVICLVNSVISGEVLMDEQRVKQEVEQVKARMVQLFPDSGQRNRMYVLLGILIVAGLMFTYKVFFYHGPVTGVYTTPPPAKGMPSKPSKKVALASIQVYDKKQAAEEMHLPPEIINDPVKEVVATALLKPTEGGYTVAAITDTSTGVTELTTREEPRPLFAFGGKSEVGALVGVTTGGEAALIYARQDIGRVGPIHLGGAVGGGMIGGKIGGGGFVDVKVSW